MIQDGEDIVTEFSTNKRKNGRGISQESKIGKVNKKKYVEKSQKQSQKTTVL